MMAARLLIAVHVSSRVGRIVEMTWIGDRIRGVRMSMLRAPKPAFERTDCKKRPVGRLFRGHRRQRACWWWSRARREVVVCHVRLVVNGSGHCFELKVELVGDGSRRRSDW